MASPIDALRAGGFNDEEINTWSTHRRDALTNAGFKENEIDAYFAGSVVAPEKAPAALVDRVKLGDAIGRVLSTTKDAVVHGYGDPTPTGFSDETFNQLIKWGIFHDPDKGKPGPLQFGAELLATAPQPGFAMSMPKMIDTALRSISAGVHGAGGIVEGILAELGEEPGMAKRAGREVVNFGNWAMIEAGFGRFVRPRMTPEGGISEPVGGLPKAQDFSDAAKVTADGTAPRPVQEKMLTLYEQQGRHPAEVATDAQADAVVKQRLLSKDPQDIPYIEAFHGSPHEFEVFSTAKIGTGEGAQSYGHGLYFAEHRGVAAYYNQLAENIGAPSEQLMAQAMKGRSREGAIANLKENIALLEGAPEPNFKPTYTISDYREALTRLERGETHGNLYKVRINADREKFLDWDKPLSEQSPEVQAILRPIVERYKAQSPILAELNIDELSGENLLRAVRETVEGPPRARLTTIDAAMKAPPAGAETSRVLREAGIPGIKYLDQGSRDVGGGTHNFVVFDDKLIEITHKNGVPVSPKIKEDILSGAGGGGKEPPKPPEPPAPGSFEAAEQKILDKISVGEREPRRPFTFDRLYTEAIDDLHPLKALDGDAYQMARLTRGHFGKSEFFLEHGTFDFETLKNTGKPLREILEPVRGDLNGLRAYLASKRTIDIEASGRTSGFDLEAAKQVVAEGGKKYEAIAGELVTYQNNLLKYLKDSGMLSEESFQAMVEANKNYVPFFRLIIPEKAPAGGGSRFGPGNPLHALKGSERAIIDPLESIIKNTYAYVSSAERNAVGVEVIDALKKQGYKVEVKRAPKADPEMAEYLKEQGVTQPDKLADFVKNVGQSDGETIGAYRNGIRETVKIDDPELVAAFNGMDRQNVGMLVKIFSVPARALRAGAVLTPDFMARNLIRDFLTAFINTGKTIFTPIDTLRGLVGVLRKDASWENWVKSGGANSTMVGLDRAYLQESLTKLNSETGLMERSWNVIKNPLGEALKTMRMLSETIENATRLGEFKALARGETTKEALQSAAFASREVTLDFARMGARMRSYNMLTAFANAQIQGVDRAIRAFKDKPVETSLKVAGGITLPSILLWWTNHDDPRYQELPHWQKDLFWIILTDSWQPIDSVDAAAKPKHLIRERNGRFEVNNGIIARIPKPFELGVIFGSGPERLLEATIAKNPEAMAGFTKSMLETLTPNFIPTAAAPLVEQFANRSTFVDRTLIPANLEKQLPEYQYKPYTTQLARKIGSVLSSFPGMREAAVEPGNVAGPAARAVTTPILIENYVRAWTGGLGMYFLEGA